MGRIITIILSAYWSVTFALSAVWSSAADRFATGIDVPAGWEAAGYLALGAACAVAAASFAWLALSVVLGDDGVPGQSDEVAYVAFAAGAVVLSLLAVAGQAAFIDAPGSGLPSLAALLASYVVIHVERRSFGRPSDIQLEQIRGAARLVALGTAHDEMVRRLGAPAMVPDNDDGMGR